ncbi:hypothetical protein EV701_11069 [Chthoniobacter flavus]|uniref:hypothetical protein n=1 Tax=Chthoniobacter flavus TaxID=191863 RepID=UPI0010F18A17|nr:hypothetical protein [Chthoniobacter flavus]TCO90446.1 hypothetical protein EV701_11069 [Chthoniobacter flavus]
MASTTAAITTNKTDFLGGDGVACISVNFLSAQRKPEGQFWSTFREQGQPVFVATRNWTAALHLFLVRDLM